MVAGPPPRKFSRVGALGADAAQNEAARGGQSWTVFTLRVFQRLGRLENSRSNSYGVRLPVPQATVHR